MTDWSAIKNAFFDWMAVKNIDLDNDIDENSRSELMKSDQFRAFIVQYDYEDNMDSFKSTSKTTKELEEIRKKEQEEREKLTEEELKRKEKQAFIDVETKELVYDMINSYLAGLDPNNKEDKVIIEAIAGKDGEISIEDRDRFVDKIIAAGFDIATDAKKENLSLEDVKIAINKMDLGEFKLTNDGKDFEFEVETPTGNSTVTQNSTTPNATTPNTTTPNGTTPNSTVPNSTIPNATEPNPTKPEATEPENPDLINGIAPEEKTIDLSNSAVKEMTVQSIEKFENVVGDYEPKVVDLPKVNVPSATLGVNLTELDTSSLTTVDSCNGALDEIDKEITSSEAKYRECKGIYQSSSAVYTKAQTYVDENNAAYNAIIKELAQSDENVQMYNDNISTLTSQQETAQSALDIQYDLKDGLSIALNGTEGKISSLEGQVGKYQEGWTDEQKEAHDANIKSQISELKAEKSRLEAELAEVAEQIIETQKTLDEICTNLDSAYEYLNLAIQDCSNASLEQREMMYGVIQNKRKMNEAYQDMQEAKSGMVAMDAYVLTLEGKHNDVCERIEELDKEAKAKEKISAENRGAGELPVDSQGNPIDGLLDTKNAGNFKEGANGAYYYECGGKTVTVLRNGNSYTYSYEGEDGVRTRLNVAGDNIAMHSVTGEGEAEEYQQIYQETTNADGSTTRTMSIDPTGDGREQRDIATTTDSNGNVISNSYQITKRDEDGNAYEVEAIIESYAYDEKGNVIGVQTQTSTITSNPDDPKNPITTTSTKEIIKEGNTTTTTITDTTGRIHQTIETVVKEGDYTTTTVEKNTYTAQGELEPSSKKYAIVYNGGATTHLWDIYAIEDNEYRQLQGIKRNKENVIPRESTVRFWDGQKLLKSIITTYDENNNPIIEIKKPANENSNEPAIIERKIPHYDSNSNFTGKYIKETEKRDEYDRPIEITISTPITENSSFLYQRNIMNNTAIIKAVYDYNNNTVTVTMDIFDPFGNKDTVTNTMSIEEFEKTRESNQTPQVPSTHLR